MTDAQQQKIARLERELDEMTAALSQAWDQLVPFLQEAPPEAETAADILPVIEAVIAAADCDFGGVYLFTTGEWVTLPGDYTAPALTPDDLRQILQPQALDVRSAAYLIEHWAFAPISSAHECIGVLGIGSRDPQRTFNAVDLRIITRMAERVGNQVSAAELIHSLEREAALQRELQIARDIQNSIQPEAPPSVLGVQIAAYWQPAMQVGGDAWGWIEQPSDELVWFILDVAGKGLPAALAAVSLHATIRMALRMQLSPATALALVNEEIYDAYTRSGLMATAAIISLGRGSGSLEIANAGHPPILIRQGGQWQRLEATAPPLGVLPMLEPQAQRIQLAKNDLVIGHSDGFSEIQTPRGLWGQTGLLNAIPSGARDVQALTQYIVAASQYAGTIEDDQTLIAALYTEDAHG